MDNVIKQRILGIIVLLALIGICITILLHNNDNTNIRHTSHHYTLPTSTPTPTVINQAPAPVQSIQQQQPTQQLTPQAAQPIQNQTPMTQAVRPQEPITPIISKVIPKAIPNVMSKTSPQNIPATLIHPSKIKHTPAAGNFTVQAGTFSKAQNAEKLVKTLQSRGFTSAKTQSVHTKKGTMTRVIVGNQLSVDSAKSLQQQLKQKLNLNGFAVLETPKSVKQKTTQQHANHPKKTSDPVITEVTIP